MGEIKIGNRSRYQIDNDYETWRTEKEYWVKKFNEIKDSYKGVCPTQQVLADMQYKFHRWQMYVGMVFNIKNNEAITVSFDFETNTLHIHLNEELQHLFD